MIIIACPSANSSDIYNLVFKGDLAFSVSLDAISSITTPFTVPLIAVWASGIFYGKANEVDLPLLPTVAKGFALIVAPMVLGMTIRRISPSFCKRLKQPFEVVSGVVLVLVVLGGVAKSWKVIKNDLGSALLPCAIIVLIALVYGLLGKLLLRIPERHSRTISFQLAIQNGSLPLLVSSMLGMPELVSGIAAYVIAMMMISYVWGYFLKQLVPLNRFKGAIIPQAKAA
jgi:bile acid:Na+ symporter, BASS family